MVDWAVVAMVNSSWELTVGSSSKEKPTVTRGVTVATPCSAGYPRKEVAQGSLSSLAVLPPRRGLGGAARENSDYLVSGAAITRAAGKAAGPDRGPCATPRVQILFSWTPMFARPFAVGGRLAVPSAYLAAEPRRVGQALPLLGDRAA